MQAKHQSEQAGVPCGSTIKNRQDQHPGQPILMRRMDMNGKKTLWVTIVAMAVFVAAGASAKANDSKNVVLGSDAVVAGTHLRSGEYNIQWETHSPEATVSFLHGAKLWRPPKAKLWTAEPSTRPMKLSTPWRMTARARSRKSASGARAKSSNSSSSGNGARGYGIRGTGNGTRVLVKFRSSWLGRRHPISGNHVPQFPNPKSRVPFPVSRLLR